MAVLVDTPTQQSHRAPAPRRRKLGRRLVIAGAVLVVLGGWLAWRAYQVRSNLNAARAALESARADVLNGGSGTAALLASAQRHTHAARAASTDPLWSLASHVPFFGATFRVAGGVAAVSDRLTQQSIPVLVDGAADLRAVRSAAGAGVPLDVVNRLAAPLSGVQDQLSADIYALQHLPSGGVMGTVQRARVLLLRDLRSLQGPVATAATAARLGPGMLGEDGPRRYLVAFENPAESRPDGGNIGGFAEVVADNGHLRVVRFGSNGELPGLGTNVASVDPAFLDAYGAHGAGRLWVNTNLSPNFPDDASAWAAMYTAGSGRTIDGVIALDPVALGELANVTGGPLSVPGVGPVQPKDLSAFLESGEYALGLDRVHRQRLVAQVGKLTLDRTFASKVSTQTLLQTLGAAAGGGHLRLASVRPDEQLQLEAFPIAGAVTRTTGHYAGAFLTNASGSKLDYYLDEQIDYVAPTCKTSTGTITVRLTNDVPTGRLPAYVTIRSDHPQPSVPVGQNRVALTVLATTGAQLQATTVDGAPLQTFPTFVAGHPAWTAYLELPPRQTRVVSLQVTEPPTANGQPTVQHQALPRPISVRTTGGC